MYGVTQGVGPRQGRTAVNTTAKPITQVGEVSSGNTTFSKTSVVDGSAWDLSDVQAGYVMKTSDGFLAMISSVDDANDTLNCQQGWVAPGGRSGRGLAALIPGDGATVRVHKMAACGSLLIDALDENTVDIYLGFSSSVSYNPASADVGHEIAATASQGNHRLVIEPQMTDELDLTEVWVICNGSSQYVCWIGM
jgi:hypothetical protein